MMRAAAITSGSAWDASNHNLSATKSFGIRGLGAFAVVCSTLALLLNPGSTLANKKTPVLPTAVLDAKTIYIDNQANDATLLNDAYLELAKWGHLQVVDVATKADVVLRFTGSAYVKAVASDTPPNMSMKPAIARAGA